MRMHRTIDTVERERERERVEFRETSFFCDAKKVVNILKIETINICANKADYQEVLGVFEILMLTDSLFFGEFIKNKIKR